TAAGPMKEAAIAKACLHGQWSADVLACIGSARTARECLTTLTPAQRELLQRQLAAWNDAYPDELLEDAGEDDDVDVADLSYVDCAQGVGDVATYAPPLTVTGDDKELATALRRAAITILCDGWATDVRRCFQDGEPLATCRGQLAPDQEQALASKLADVAGLTARAAALRKQPAKLTCPRVAATHYGDGAWRGKLDAIKGAERRKLIADSRAKLAKACTADAWSPNLRACLVAGGGEACFAAISPALARAWGYPAGGLVVKTGIPECDSYGDALRALAQCPQVPRAAAQSLLDSYQQTAASFASTPIADRPARAAACKLGDVAIRQSASGLGCTI
nr:hypothetical protein [Deltaproteobacteria bacterium]